MIQPSLFGRLLVGNYLKEILASKTPELFLLSRRADFGILLKIFLGLLKLHVSGKSTFPLKYGSVLVGFKRKRVRFLVNSRLGQPSNLP